MTQEAEEDPRLDPIMRRIWFEMVDAQGYPNGMPTWNELLELAEKDYGMRCQVILVGSIAQGVLEVVDDLQKRGGDAKNRPKQHQ